MNYPQDYIEHQKKMNALIKKAKEEWNEDWNLGMMSFDAENNCIDVFVDKFYPDSREYVYKAFFDADTLKCLGTKC